MQPEIRILRPEDAPRVQDFVRRLSPQSRRDRCFSPQGSGLGHELMQRLLAHAREKGLCSMHGLVRAGNLAMLRLARRLGFSAARDEDPDLVRVELPLSRGRERRLLAHG